MEEGINRLDLESNEVTHESLTTNSPKLSPKKSPPDQLTLHLDTSSALFTDVPAREGVASAVPSKSDGTPKKGQSNTREGGKVSEQERENNNSESNAKRRSPKTKKKSKSQEKEKQSVQGEERVKEKDDKEKSLKKVKDIVVLKQEVETAVSGGDKSPNENEDATMMTSAKTDDPIPEVNAQKKVEEKVLKPEDKLRKNSKKERMAGSAPSSPEASRRTTPPGRKGKKENGNSAKREGDVSPKKTN